MVRGYPLGPCSGLVHWQDIRRKGRVLRTRDADYIILLAMMIGIFLYGSYLSFQCEMPFF